MISTLAKSLLTDILQAVPKADIRTSEQFTQLQAQLQTQLESALQKMNLVSRDEFDAQATRLLRTQKHVEELKQQLAELEEAIHSSDNQ